MLNIKRLSLVNILVPILLACALWLARKDFDSYIVRPQTRIDKTIIPGVDVDIVNDRYEMVFGDQIYNVRSEFLTRLREPCLRDTSIAHQWELRLGDCKYSIAPQWELRLGDNDNCIAHQWELRLGDNNNSIAHQWELRLGVYNKLKIIKNEHINITIDQTIIWFTWNIYLNIFIQISILFETKVKCMLIKLFIFRSLFKRHDFWCLIKALFSNKYMLLHNNFYIVVNTLCSHKVIIITNIILHLTNWCFYRCANYIYVTPVTPVPTYKIECTNLSYQQDTLTELYKHRGGGHSEIFSYKELEPYIKDNKSSQIQDMKFVYRFHSYCIIDRKESSSNRNELITCNVPFNILLNRLSVSNLKVVAAVHGIYIKTRTSQQDMIKSISEHKCQSCPENVTLFQLVKSQEARRQEKNIIAVKQYRQNLKHNGQHKTIVSDHTINGGETLLCSSKVQKVKPYKQEFPPKPLSINHQLSIVQGWCRDMLPSCFEETGCSVCGELVLHEHSLPLKDLSLNLGLLNCDPGITLKQRKSDNDPIEHINGPVLEDELTNICKSCHKSLLSGRVPKFALANGMWLGKVPSVLKDLTFAEKLLISRVRHNRFLIRVSSGWHKMTANAISFANPTPKIYNILPPPVNELDEVLAFIYTGPCKPTPKDFERTPLLVRRKTVGLALDWLRLNHCDYYDIEISQQNLNSYPENGIPVVVEYLSSVNNKAIEATAVYDNEEEAGTESGKCPFAVHGLTGEEYTSKSLKALKAIAVKHLTSNGKILAIGHAQKPESLYNNPQLYPQMMPWLFPYGLGGIGMHFQKDSQISDLKYKRHLLLYHDKRFQKDPHFPLIAFNHEQIKDTTTAGYLLSEKAKFNEISDRLLQIDKSVLNNICDRMAKDIKVVPDSDEEKNCFKLLSDLDHVGGHVMGSITCKKFMRNEIWSLISFIGAPSWFITFAPADNLHPISLYLADTKEEFKPIIRGYDERYRIMSQNPVAGARFFHFLCQLFIKHILGVGSKHAGLYGETEAYYGTVEQQGRLALHLHLLLWIKGSLSPQEMRDKIMDPNSDFQKKLVEYLESVHIGEFMTGSMEKVVSDVQLASTQNADYKDPTQTLPEKPPAICKHTFKGNCASCKKTDTWWSRFKGTVDDILLKSNMHTCGGGKTGRRPTCINKQGNCKARFPRPTFKQTEVDPKTGALNLKKGEPWMNTVTPALTYVLRCNTDVTSLLSGTAVKAIVAYISDYVTKTALKTYTMFDAIKGVYERNSEMLGGSFSQKEKARKLVTQVMNSLTAKSEIGSPMASLYLLGNPDHYTSHKFVPFYWKTFVNHVFKVQTDDKYFDDLQPTEKVVIQKHHSGKIVAYTPLHDYIYRPTVYQHLSLYTWIQTAQKSKIPKVKTNPSIHNDAINDTEDELDIMSQIGCLDVPLDSKQVKEIVELETEDDELDVLSDTTCDEKSKLTDKKMKQYSFLKDHPQHETHQVTSNSKRYQHVINFLGGSLPRCDRGDREYYCATMLVLFKPWRKLDDLKDSDFSWDEMFTKYSFTPHQLQLMKNFNLRYECNDARDDYSSQLKKKNGSLEGLSMWMASDFVDDNDNNDSSLIDNEDGDYNNDIDQIDDNFDKYMKLGRYGSIKQAEMEATKFCLQSVGWLDDSPNGFPNTRTAPIEPDTIQLGTKWKSVVNDKRQEIIAERDSRNVKNNESKSQAHTFNENENEVKIIDKSYLTKSFTASIQVSQEYIDSIVKEFTLNEEQERAFRIIANHASALVNIEQLKMYIGGMAGTGKSQVIKALIKLFHTRQEKHRFVVLGPTGTAAALNNGSTYHSFLGIQIGGSHGKKAEAIAIAQLKARLEGVDYIFIDEVSMLACHELYKISSQLAKALNQYDAPFGGLNIIFAGDFAQLPPVGGKTLYSNAVSTQVTAGLSVRDQEAAIGKALWHQITTVVLLRQNMRQKTQTPQDNLLRTALINMRYGKCTPEDIRFLKGLVAGRRPEQPNIATKDFRNVAIICGRHTQKDQINITGCERFAKDTGQKLVDFYSIDRWGSSFDPSLGKQPKKKFKGTEIAQTSKDIPLQDQMHIWNLRPGATEHFPGKLSLCLGMPVMIRNNEATELCITKGQEGFVAGWQSIVGPHGKQVLDTLFIELDRPPRTIQIPGLPENVVPIVKDKKTIECTFPSDLKASIERQQVWVLPNFAMTDYASQGKTRPFNVAHLSSCSSHQSYYTCLSRSASAAGTIIVQGFEPRVITSGCSGYLRQEFREQEILDDITKLRYENELPDHIEGNRRNTIIRQYQKWKGTSYVPSQIDQHLSWKTQDDMKLLPVITDSPWQLVSKTIQNDSKATKQTKNASNFVVAQGSAPLPAQNLKRKLEDNDSTTCQSRNKCIRTERPEQPLGLIWDSKNYSCAYDALLTVLYDVWKQNPFLWNVNSKFLKSTHLNFLSDGFMSAQQGKKSLENVRDDLRKILHAKNKDMFPYGYAGTSVSELACELLHTTAKLAECQLVCTVCDFVKDPIYDRQGCVFLLDKNALKSTSYSLRKSSHPSKEICPECRSPMINKIYYTIPPVLLIFDHIDCQIKPSREINFITENNKAIKLQLRGLIYFGGFHFTSRIISIEGDIWYHDGKEMGSNCNAEGHRKMMSDEDWQTCDGRSLSLSIYTKV